MKRIMQLLAIALLTATSGWADDPPPPSPFPAAGGKPESGGEIRAELLPVQYTTLSSEMAGRIVQLPLQEGESFKKGDLLIAFACEREQALVEKAEAQYKAASSRSAVSRRLVERNAASLLEVQVAEAEIAQTSADVKLAREMVSHCLIHAPFDGRIASLVVREHQYVKAGDRTMDILDPSHLEAHFLLPSHWVNLYQPGDRFQLQVFETGHRYPMTLLRFGARMDAVSQSIKAIGTIDGVQHDLLPGMSGLVLPLAEGKPQP